MWIRSQTKGELVPIKHKLSIVCEHDRATLEDKYLIRYQEDILGTYATKERALEVLDEIQTWVERYEANKNNLFSGHVVYEMPEE